MLPSSKLVAELERHIAMEWVRRSRAIQENVLMMVMTISGWR